LTLARQVIDSRQFKSIPALWRPSVGSLTTITTSITSTIMFTSITSGRDHDHIVGWMRSKLPYGNVSMAAIHVGKPLGIDARSKRLEHDRTSIRAARH
jgi:hypothetical protein